MKYAILEKIRAELRHQLDRLTKAAMEAHAAATDPGSKAESKYDTRNLEASYLASGQARQVGELAGAVRIFDALQFPDFSPEDAVDAGALVKVEIGGKREFFLLVPTCGGLEISHAGVKITLLTPESGLYRKLLEMRVGETLETPSLILREIS